MSTVPEVSAPPYVPVCLYLTLTLLRMRRQTQYPILTVFPLLVAGSFPLEAGRRLHQKYK